MGRQKMVLLLTVFIDMICFSMFIPVMPYLVEEMHLSKFTGGLIVMAFAIMNFACSAYWGSMSDRRGRKPVILLSIAITLISNLILAQAQTVLLLFLARILAGIGSANISVAQAYMADISSAEDRTKNMGIFGAMFGLGFIIGPPIGGWLKHFSGEGTVLWVGLGAAILNGLNLVSAWFFLQESNTERDTSRRSLNPITPIIRWLGSDGRPAINRLMLLFFLYVVAFSTMQTTSGFLWKKKFGLTEQESGYLFMFIGVTSAIGQGLLVGPLSKKYSSPQLIIAGSTIMAVSLAAIPLPPAHNFLPLTLIICSFISFGNALITPAVSSWLSREAPRGETGQVMGANQSFSSLARAIGPPMGTGIFAWSQSLPFFLSGMIMLLPLFIILSMHRKNR